MRDKIFLVDRGDPLTLQDQIQEKLVSAILSGTLAPGSPLPSTRMLAKQLNVSRNTVTLAYQALEFDGYLASRERSGFFVTEDVEPMAGCAKSQNSQVKQESTSLKQSMVVQPSSQPNIEKPLYWQTYPYPFVYGQADPSLFPLQEWRDCTRQAVGKRLIDAWTEDSINQDDPMFVEQIRQRILPRRGIDAAPDEILVTLGAQNAIYIISQLLVSSNTQVGIEDPGYPDARNIFALNTDNLKPISIDEQGIMFNKDLKDCKIVYVTPSHQMPTNITMSLKRRQQLLEWSMESGSLIIEDDYESETNYLDTPTPALKSFGNSSNVIYVGSLSKSLVPGLRIGYMVGPRELIEEARALRRLMLRHPPGNNQRVVALFLALGHHNSLVARLHRTYKSRWNTIKESLQNHLSGWAQNNVFGGTSIWVKGPDDLNGDRLAEHAREYGVLIEPGSIFFSDSHGNKNYFRLGISSIANEKIEAGIKNLALAVESLD